MISILIPYYRIIFFKETLLSLANQTNKRFHVFIFDDNSLESPNKLLKDFEGDFSFSYYKFEINLGRFSLVKHWERCLNLIDSGDWIMILGDDDVLSPNVIHDFYKKEKDINALNIDVVRFSTVMINDDGYITSKIYNFPEVESSINSLMNKLKGLTRSSLSEYVFRRNKFYDYSFKDYPNALFSDDILILEHSSFKSIFTINSSVIQIRKSTVNLSGGIKIPNRYKSILEFYKTLLIEFKEKFDKVQVNYIEYKLEREIFNHKKIIIVVFLLRYYLGSAQFFKLMRLLIRIITRIPKLIYLK